MSIKRTLGGDRIGSGNKMNVDLHGYERSTHDLGYVWRSTMAPGTLVPFLSKVALPGDTWDITLNTETLTLPTIGPLFGSYKLQLDIYQAPVRLYQAQLHNNKLKIGMNMANVKLPQMLLTSLHFHGSVPEDIDNCQINPSCILSYLGVRGVGLNNTGSELPASRNFNAIPWLAYWEIYKQYYANKQEEIGAVIHSPAPTVDTTWITSIEIFQASSGLDETLGQSPIISNLELSQASNLITITLSGIGTPNLDRILINTSIGNLSPNELALNISQDATHYYINYNYDKYGTLGAINWRYPEIWELPATAPQIVTFPLDNIDDMREYLLSQATLASSAVVLSTSNTPIPYNHILHSVVGQPETTAMVNSQEGLALKTYQSDLLNNWLQTEWIDGVGGISEVTAIDTSGGSFTIDTLVLSKKVYQMLNRLAVSGGTYDDWIEVQYDQQVFARAESPIYHGGLSKEIIFQEVVNNSASPGQPLGTLAGRGRQSQKHKGGKVTIKVAEHSWIIGIISITPRLDYSQGNTWDMLLETMDDFHKPALDEIGFEDLSAAQLAWWASRTNNGTDWVTPSVGKQPAWINYMTSINQTRGNFAIPSKEMFMTLNRRYQWDGAFSIEDITTYVDPVKFNHIFAETAIDAQNFWVQVAIDATVRRKMSGKIMPNL